MHEEPKIQQLFDTPSSLPDITLRPDSSAARVKSATTTTPHAGVPRLSSGSTKVDFPLTPLQVLEKYSRVLSAFERTEISKYPQIYFLGPLARKIQAGEGKGPNFGFDDEKGRYKCVKNDHIGYRYEVLKALGKGSFGDVVKAYDHKTKTHTALKIIRNERRFHKQGEIEVQILDQLRRDDRAGKYNLIHMQDHFLFRDHLCITFELLHTDLYSALKKDSFKGFSMTSVRNMTASILSCMRLLRRRKIIHCDLKPENILLCSKSGDSVKVIDFGSACFDHKRIHSYIQSRFYRSPEVIVGASYTTAIDMWSLGCIICELLTGHPIFPGRDEKEQLMFQMEILGIPPTSFLDQGKRASAFFDVAGNPKSLTDRKGRTHLPATKSLSQAIGIADSELISFLKGCFEWDPSMRMTPRDAAHHPWLQSVGDKSATSPAGPTRLHRSLSEGAQIDHRAKYSAAKPGSHLHLPKLPSGQPQPSKISAAK